MEERIEALEAQEAKDPPAPAPKPRRPSIVTKPVFLPVIDKNESVLRPPAAVPFAPVIELWAKEATPSGKELSKMVGTSKALIDWLGRDDMRIEPEQMIAYKESMIAAGNLAPGTIGYRLKYPRILFKWAVKNRKIPANPMEGVEYQGANVVVNSRQAGFPDADAGKILTLARTADPLVKWLNWIMAFSGMRDSEIGEMDVREIVCLGGVWAFDLKEDFRMETSPAHRLKAGPRLIPIHPALLAEGFLDYVRSRPASGPLFAGLTPDKHGRHGGAVPKKNSDFMRNVVGIKDPKKTAYCWRHMAASVFRDAEAVKGETKDYLLGHTNRTIGASYGRRNLGGALRRAIELLPNPLADA